MVTCKEYLTHSIHYLDLKKFLEGEGKGVYSRMAPTDGIVNIIHYLSSTVKLELIPTGRLLLAVWSDKKNHEQSVFNNLEMILKGFTPVKTKDVEKGVREAEDKLKGGYKCPGVIVPEEKA